MSFYTRFKPPKSEGFNTLGESRTRQEYLKESLTSTIIERFTKTGVLVPPGQNRRPALFGDFTEVPESYAEAFNLCQRVRAQFDSLPAKIRQRFGNNPMLLHQFLMNTANRDEAIKLGLIAKPSKPSKPKAAEAANPAAAEAASATPAQPAEA